FGRPGAAIPNVAGGILYNSTGNTDGLQFRTGGNFTRMTIDNAGNVGIGTVNPSAKLHVVGSSSDVILPSGSLSAAEVADEPGLACDIANTPDGFSPFSSLHIAATRTITAPADGFVLAIGTVTVNGDLANDTNIFVGVSSSS